MAGLTAGCHGYTDAAAPRPESDWGEVQGPADGKGCGRSAPTSSPPQRARRTAPGQPLPALAASAGQGYAATPPGERAALAPEARDVPPCGTHQQASDSQYAGARPGAPTVW